MKEKESFKERVNKPMKFMLLDANTFEERFSMLITKWQVWLLGAIVVLLIGGITFSIFSFTPLKRLIPGYPSGDYAKVRKLDQLNIQKIAELEQELDEKDVWIKNIQLVLSGQNPDSLNMENASFSVMTSDTSTDIDFNQYPEDSALMAKVKQEEMFEIGEVSIKNDVSTKAIYFFSPVKGEVTEKFDKEKKHFGVDIIAPANEPVMAVSDGIVIFSGWTIKEGHVIYIQHNKGFVSVFKHNSAVLKTVGEKVKASDAIAIIGNTGELSTGPHVHFELWESGTPLDPEKYVSF